MTYSLLHDTTKKMRFAWNFSRERLVHLNLQILYSCNFRCTICDFWKDPFRQMPRLSARDVEVIADKLKEVGPQLISLGGGEPLMHDELTPIAEALCRDNFVVMISNGWLMTKERARALWNAGLYEVSVSLDYADPAKHDAQRGVEGAHARALEALRTLHEERVHPHQRVNMISVVMEDNLEEIEPLIELSADLGISYLVTFYSPGRGRARPGFQAGASARLLELKKRYRHFVSLSGYLGRFTEASSATGIVPCRAGQNLWNIDCQGNVTLCIDRLSDPAGNILTDDLPLIVERLHAKQQKNDCGLCWTSCRGPIETLMYGANRVVNLRDYYQMTRDVALGQAF